MKRILPMALMSLAALPAAAENRIDVIRPDAPALAAYGDYKVGVQTMTFTNMGQVDVAQTQADGDVPTYDRPLTVEIWYPAAADTAAGGSYQAMMRDGTDVTLQGQAVRDAAALTGETFPLVIISHGYPGNRWLLGHLGENLASKGYVVASIDHTDSNYDDMGNFGSTLYNRPWDQKFVIDSMESLDGDLGAITDASNTAVVGYSMGGYGALILAGAGLTEAITSSDYAPPQGLLERNVMGSDTHAELEDDRIKAFAAFGPWGNNRGFWDADGLAGIDKPLLLIAGSVDDVSEYDAIRGIFDGAVNSDRHLLTYLNANHNAGAPMPSPEEGYAINETLGWAPFEHYGDAVWDNVRMNNIAQHFVTAWVDQNLKGADMSEYFDLTPSAADGVWAVDDAGEPTQDNTYWTGFANRTAVGLTFESKPAGE
ncbi:Alpha/beta hydrolase family protein [Loktanella salsilacus]|uniref:Alpha/beta hydrolase family protein n=1 Tax=Loktanella salsilacus TaxID=195913 RepID=A0A1I4EUX6_9RHOB|nr:dienelactone hydrolase [Loktanella salsilacus]SFL07951.1 Alpha/beta hydrolase family protein [Loktanella salsilacus]